MNHYEVLNSETIRSMVRGFGLGQHDRGRYTACAQVWRRLCTIARECDGGLQADMQMLPALTKYAGRYTSEPECISDLFLQINSEFRRLGLNEIN